MYFWNDASPRLILQQDAREVVELAQRRGDPGDPIEAELFDVLELTGDAQQWRNHEAVRLQDRDCCDDYRQGGERDQQVIALRSIDARKSLAGITVATTQSLKFSGEKVTK